MALMLITGRSKLKNIQSVSSGRFLRFKTPFLGDAQTIFSVYYLNDSCWLHSILITHPKN